MSGATAPQPTHLARGRLRIVIPALWHFRERSTGSSRLAWDEAQYLASLGHEVWLVAQHATADGAPGEYVREVGVHVLRYVRPPWAAFDPRPRSVHLRRTRRLLDRYVAAPVDVVHCHTLLTGAAALDAYPTARKCYSLHSPAASELLATARGAAWPHRLRLRLAAAASRRLERRCLAACSVVTTESAFARDLVVHDHGGAVAARVQVLPGWADFSKFVVVADRSSATQRLGWPGDRPVLFCLRRLVPRMGLDRLLDAAARLRSQGCRFLVVVAGTGPEREALLARSAALRLGEQVAFTGGVPDDVLPLMYGASDAFVLPTAELECFGLIAVEALACGRPVLGTPVGAIPEIIGELEPAWLAEDATADAIARLIARFLAGQLPHHEPCELREFAERRYSATRILPRLAALATGESGPTMRAGEPS